MSYIYLTARKRNIRFSTLSCYRNSRFQRNGPCSRLGSTVFVRRRRGRTVFPTNKAELGLVSNKSSGIPPEKSKNPSLQLFQEESGFTTQVQHKIHLRENVPASRKFYRIPAAAWVIERSTNGEA